MFTLLPGKHHTREEGMCLMELVAYLAGETHSDNPKCASPTVSLFARASNDLLHNEDRQELIPLAWEIMGSRCNKCESARLRALTDYGIVRLAPKLEPYYAECTVNRLLFRQEQLSVAVLVSQLVRTVYKGSEAVQPYKDIIRHIIAVCPHRQEWTEKATEGQLVCSV